MSTPAKYEWRFSSPLTTPPAVKAEFEAVLARVHTKKQARREAKAASAATTKKKKVSTKKMRKEPQ